MIEKKFRLKENCCQRNSPLFLYLSGRAAMADECYDTQY